MGLLSRFSKQKKQSKNEMPQQQTETVIVVPLGGRLDFTPDMIAKYLKADWGGSISSIELPNAAPGAMTIGVTYGSGRLLMTFRDTPIPRDLVELSLEASKHSAVPLELKDEEAREFYDNQAHLILSTPVNVETGRIQAALATKVLLSVLKNVDRATGYIAISSMTYRPKRWLSNTFSRLNEVDSADEVVALGNVHVVRNGELWVHTHGMEQFGVPDIECFFTDEGRSKYYLDLVGDAAIYTAMNGPVLKVGDTAEIAGDGIVYRIGASREDLEHPFGAFGAIRIERK